MTHDVVLCLKEMGVGVSLLRFKESHQPVLLHATHEAGCVVFDAFAEEIAASAPLSKTLQVLRVKREQAREIRTFLDLLVVLCSLADVDPEKESWKMRAAVAGMERQNHIAKAVALDVTRRALEDTAIERDKAFVVLIEDLAAVFYGFTSEDEEDDGEESSWRATIQDSAAFWWIGAMQERHPFFALDDNKRPQYNLWHSLKVDIDGSRKMSHLAEHFLLQAKAANLAPIASEFLFHPQRRWRLDFAWLAEKVAVEVHGGIWTENGSGRHATGAEPQSDREKMNEAQLLGWIVLEVTERHIKSGLALCWLEAALNERRKK